MQHLVVYAVSGLGHVFVVDGMFGTLRRQLVGAWYRFILGARNIVRPPLVYGPGVKGNFASMMRCLQRGIPVPLGSITENRRSFVALSNLVDLLMTCIDHPAAANETFLVSDGEDLSTTDLLRRLGIAMGQSARLLPLPSALLQAVAILLDKGDMAQRLLGNLRVDITHTCQTLGWKPPIDVDEGLRRAVQGLSK